MHRAACVHGCGRAWACARVCTGPCACTSVGVPGRGLARACTGPRACTGVRACACLCVGGRACRRPPDPRLEPPERRGGGWFHATGDARAPGRAPRPASLRGGAPPTMQFLKSSLVLLYASRVVCPWPRRGPRSGPGVSSSPAPARPSGGGQVPLAPPPPRPPRASLAVPGNRGPADTLEPRDVPLGPRPRETSLLAPAAWAAGSGVISRFAAVVGPRASAERPRPRVWIARLPREKRGWDGRGGVCVGG